MATYDEVITRDSSNDPLEIPEEVSSEIIQDLPQSSAVMALSRRVTMSSRKYRQPVLDVLPDAYWVTGDTGLKQTTAMDWVSVTLTAEPIAALVVVPDEYMADSAVPIWSQVRPRLVSAIGKAVDNATLWGTNKPSTWTSSAIYTGANAAGNFVSGGDFADLAADVARMGYVLAQDGFPLTGFAAAPGFHWRLVGQRSTQGDPIYTPSLAASTPSTLYGYPMPEVVSGAWASNTAMLIGGDWSKSIIGVRQDITFQIFDSAVISDDSGNVVFNSMQQDSKIMRVVARIAWATAVPTTQLTDSGYPWVVLKPGDYLGS